MKASAKEFLPVYALIAALLFVPAHAQTGKLKVCKNTRIVSAADDKAVAFPAIHYTGACDKDGENCRQITLAGEGGAVGKARGACTVITATVTKADGKPIRAGQKLLSSYGSYEVPDIMAQIFIGSAAVSVAEDFK